MRLDPLPKPVRHLRLAELAGGEGEEGDHELCVGGGERKAIEDEKGFAHDEGLELTLLRETSWANIRDRLIVGHFDAAHMLGPMTVASSLGVGHVKAPMAAPCSLGLGGTAIAVSSALWQRMAKHGAALGADP